MYYGAIMKKFILFLLIIAGFSTIWLYMTERTGLIPLSGAALDDVHFTDENGVVTMRWKPLPYPCRYEVECFSKTTGRTTDGKPQLHRFSSGTTTTASFQVPPTTIPMFYQVSAYGLFGKIAGPFPTIPHPAYTEPFSPHSVLHYTEDAPASLKPYLVWHPVPGAVCGLTADILGSFLSGYAPHPLILTAAAVWGILPSLSLLYLGKGSRKRKIIAICCGIVASGLAGTMGLTYAGLVMLGYNPAAIFSTRVIQFVMMTPVYSAVSCFLYFGPVTGFLDSILKG